MRRYLVGSMVVLGIAVASAVPTDAAGLGGKTNIKSKSWFSKTIETTVYTVTNWEYEFNEPSAQYTATTVTVTFCGRTWTSTCTTLTISQDGLPPENDGDPFSFYYEGGTWGTAIQENGAVSLSLSSKRGDTIRDPSQQGVLIADDTTQEFGGTAFGLFELTSQTTTTCGGR